MLTSKIFSKENRRIDSREHQDGVNGEYAIFSKENRRT